MYNGLNNIAPVWAFCGHRPGGDVGGEVSYVEQLTHLPCCDVTRSIDLFASAVPYYAAYRSGYPVGEVDGLATHLGLDGTQRALDIGCATGQLAIPLARHVRHLTAIDPVEAMLARGRQAALAAGASNVTWTKGDSSQLARLVGPGAHLAAFAASFHWTDREVVTQELDRLLAAEGAIVVINEDLEDSEQPEWVKAIAEVRARYLPAGRATNPSRPNPGHYDLLSKLPVQRSAEAQLGLDSETHPRAGGRAPVSYSFSTPAILQNQAALFADDVREIVLASHPSGDIPEPFRVEVLVATRP